MVRRATAAARSPSARSTPSQTRGSVTRTLHGSNPAAMPTRFLPAAASAFLKRRFTEIAGLLPITMAILMALALVSYHTTDPSWNVSTQTAAQNWLGSTGSHMADVLIQVLGIAACVPVLVLFGWGFRVIRHLGLPRFLLHLFLTPLATLILATALSTLPAPEAWPLPVGLGGLAGHALLSQLVSILTPIGIPASEWLYTPVLLPLGGLLTIFAMALPAHDWWAASQALHRLVSDIGDIIIQAVSVLIRILHAMWDSLPPMSARPRASQPIATAGTDQAAPFERAEPDVQLYSAPPQTAPAPSPVEPSEAHHVWQQHLAPVITSDEQDELVSPAAAYMPAPAPAAPDYFAPQQPMATTPMAEHRTGQDIPVDQVADTNLVAPHVPPVPASEIQRTAPPTRFEPAPVEVAAPESDFHQSDFHQSDLHQSDLHQPALYTPHQADQQVPMQAQEPMGPAPISAAAAPHTFADTFTEPPSTSTVMAPAAEPESYTTTSPAPALAPEPQTHTQTHTQPHDGRAIQVAEPKPSTIPEGQRAAKEAQPELNLNLPEDVLPTLSLLQPMDPDKAIRHDPDVLEGNARMLEGVLDDFGVQGRIEEARPGPVVTVYELEPAKGTKTSRVIGLSDDIARSMSAISVRAAVVPGRSVIGIEIPNAERETVFLREMLASEAFENAPGALNVVLGKDIEGQPVIADLAKMPHVLVAGTTGSGKSVGVNAMILSLLYQYTPEQLRLIMVDPKILELSVYEDIPHLLTPVVTEPGKAVVALKWAVREMDDRYRQMAQMGVRNIASFNEKLKEAKARSETITREVQTGFDPETNEPIIETQELDLEPLPYIVILVDEFADLMMMAGKDVEACVLRIAQKARAAGIHLVMATQRPSVDVVTGTIKANFPSRISFKVTAKQDSRTILGQQGAEQLLGMGDMLYMSSGGRLTRVHGPFVSDDEVEKVADFLRSTGRPKYISSVTEEEEQVGGNPDDPLFASSGDSDDDLYQQAVDVVRKHKKASTSFIQRHLKIGYNRAARLVEQMEEERLISPPNHVGKREILMDVE